MCDPGPGPEDREGMGWDRKGLEAPPRGSSFNLEQGCVVGSGGAACRGAGAGQPGAGGRPCSCLSVLSLCLCVCVCQAALVLPARTSCEPVALQHIPVPAGADWYLQGRLEGSGIQPAPGIAAGHP